MAEIVGFIHPETLKEQQAYSDPKFVRFCREERARVEGLRRAAQQKRITARRSEEKVMSGKFNSIKAR